MVAQTPWAPAVAKMGWTSQTEQQRLHHQTLAWRVHFQKLQLQQSVAELAQVEDSLRGAVVQTPAAVTTAWVQPPVPASGWVAAAMLQADQSAAAVGSGEPEAKRQRTGEMGVLSSPSSAGTSQTPPPPPPPSHPAAPAETDAEPPPVPTAPPPPFPPAATPPPPPPPEIPRIKVGFLPEGTTCQRCHKVVLDRGGTFCGRTNGDSVARGCGAAVCWRCMNRAPKEELGKIRTTKMKFESLGDRAWWMHESCMQPEDRTEYDTELTSASDLSSLQ